MPIKKLADTKEFDEFIGNIKTSVVLFVADWADQCNQVVDVAEDLSKMLAEKLQFARISAEDQPEISMKYQVDAVPTIIFFYNSKAVDRVNGVNIGEMTSKCRNLAATTPGGPPETLKDRLKALINKAPVMVFMKGDRDTPRCGFSKTLIQIINDTGAAYETFDILGDEEVRQGLKTYSDWPTYPQVYVKGELIGGLDIVKEMVGDGSLAATLKD